MSVLPSYRNQSTDLLCKSIDCFHIRATLAFNGLIEMARIVSKSHLSSSPNLTFFSVPLKTNNQGFFCFEWVGGWKLGDRGCPFRVSYSLSLKFHNLEANSGLIQSFCEVLYEKSTFQRNFQAIVLFQLQKIVKLFTMTFTPDFLNEKNLQLNFQKLLCSYLQKVR